MSNKAVVSRAALAVLGCFVASSASAAVVTWTDWTSITSSGASGTMGGVSVTATATTPSINGVSQTGCGTNYWTEPNAADPAYTGGSVSNAPTACEQVGLSSPVSITVSFSTPVDGLYMALLSVGQPGLTVTYDFDHSFTVDSDGIGYWSFANGGLPGPYSLGAGDSIAMNEFHGLLQFSGQVSSLTFTTSPTEFWHAFTFGAAQVPEPGTLALLGLGLAGLAAVGRRKR